MHGADEADRANYVPDLDAWGERFLRRVQEPAGRDALRFALKQALDNLEKHRGSAYRTNEWREKDFQRALAQVLDAHGDLDVIQEITAAAAQRIDVGVRTRFEMPERSMLIELKLADADEPGLGQAEAYRHRHGQDWEQVHLVLLDRRPGATAPWGAAPRPCRHDEERDIHVWRVHVNRDPASSAG